MLLLLLLDPVLFLRGADRSYTLCVYMSVQYVRLVELDTGQASPDT